MRQRVRELLESVSTLSLATIGASGAPHAANLNFAVGERLRPFFISRPDSAHARDLEADLRIAATLYAPFATLERIAGLQIRGTCAPLPAEAFDACWEIFRRKFPYAAPLESLARAEQRFFRIEPEWVRLIDNSRGFGFRREGPWPVFSRSVS